MKNAVPPTSRRGARVDHARAALVRAAQEGVGGAAHPQPAPSAASSSAALRRADPERLFGIDVLAGGDAHEAHLDVGRGNRQVEHDFDAGRRAALARLVACTPNRGAPPPPRDEVGDAADVEDGKRRAAFR